MSIVKMKRVRLFGMRADRDEVLRVLQRLGCVEISEPTDKLEDPAWAGVSRPDDSALNAAREVSTCATAALDILKKYAPAKGGMLKPRPEISEKEFFNDEAYASAQENARRLVDTDRRIHALYAEQSKLRGQKLSIAPWLTLDVPLETESTREMVIRFGTVAATVDLAAFRGALDATSDLCELTEVSVDSESRYLFFVCHRSVYDAVDEVLKEYGFTRTSLRGWTGTAAENDRRLDAEIARLGKEAESAKQELTKAGDLRLPIQRCADRAGQEIDREDSKCRLLDTGATFFLEGWVPASEVEKLRRSLAPFLCAWETEDPAPDDYPEVPVQLKNNALTAPLSVVTEMYSLPAYDGLDPNPLMAPFFIAFFGMMMADMAYGIIMIAAALVVLLKTRPRRGTRNFMGLVLLCGISTFIVGAMTGGFFGDFIPQILKIINPESTFQMPALFTPLDDTVNILLGSLVLGAIQVFTGMLISVIKKIKDGDFIDALFDEITWWIILGGGAMAFFGIGNVGGVPVVLAIGGLMLVFGGTRKAKGFGKLSCLVGLVYNGVTGFFSDILSYMRLMALMLAGSVIAQVFNTLGSVFGNVVVFVIISLIGNALNLALNLLGCYVHDLRLQCLEFFGRFYKEGGKPFRPLNMDTKYVDIIKEEL